MAHCIKLGVSLLVCKRQNLLTYVGMQLYMTVKTLPIANSCHLAHWIHDKPTSIYTIEQLSHQ